METVRITNPATVGGSPRKVGDVVEVAASEAALLRHYGQAVTASREDIEAAKHASRAAVKTKTEGK